MTREEKMKRLQPAMHCVNQSAAELNKFANEVDTVMSVTADAPDLVTLDDIIGEARAMRVDLLVLEERLRKFATT